MSLLIIAIPQAYILVVVCVVIGALSVLAAVGPMAIITLAVGKGVDALPFPTATHVLTLIDVTVFIDCNTLSMRFSVQHFTFIFSFKPILTNQTRA